MQVQFRPAAPGTGIVFVRTDYRVPVRIPALVAHRIEVPRRTTLVCQKATVEMVEHILAALAGLQIDNCEVAVNEPEMPGCDGSSQPFVEAIDRAGIVEQNASRDRLVIREFTRVGDENAWIEARVRRPSRACRCNTAWITVRGTASGGRSFASTSRRKPSGATWRCAGRFC